MNVEYMLNSTYGKNEISIDLDIIKQIGAFQTVEVISSMESLILTLNKHQPIKRYSFDEGKLKVWCKRYNFIHCIDELNRVVYFKRIEMYNNQ